MLRQIKISTNKNLPWPFFDSPVHQFTSSPVSRVVFDFIGDGFLKQMVRNIVGTLVEVGQGSLTPKDVKGILRAKDRKKAPPPAGPQGLYLIKVFY